MKEVNKNHQSGKRIKNFKRYQLSNEEKELMLAQIKQRSDNSTSKRNPFPVISMTMVAFVSFMLFFPNIFEEDKDKMETSNHLQQKSNESQEQHSNIELPDGLDSQYEDDFKSLPSGIREEIVSGHLVAQYNGSNGFRRRLEIAAEYTDDLFNDEVIRLQVRRFDHEKGEYKYSTNREEVKAILNIKP